MEFLRNMTGIEKIIIAIIAVILIGLAWTGTIEKQKWEAFRERHDCKIVGKTDSDVGIGTGITSNGNATTTTIIIPGKTAWLCDDGVTYWRRN